MARFLDSDDKLTFWDINVTCINKDICVPSPLILFKKNIEPYIHDVSKIDDIIHLIDFKNEKVSKEDYILHALGTIVTCNKPKFIVVDEVNNNIHYIILGFLYGYRKMTNKLFDIVFIKPSELTKTEFELLDFFNIITISSFERFCDKYGYKGLGEDNKETLLES